MENITAVQWLKTEIENYGDPEYLIIRWTDFDELINQAKQTENKHIEKAYEQGTLDGYEPNYGSGKQYYNETFGNH